MSVTRHRRLGRFATRTSLLLSAGAIALAACGGASPQHAQAPAQGHATPLQSNPDVGTASAQVSPAAATAGKQPATAGPSARQSARITDRIAAAGGIQRARQGTSDHEQPASAPKPLNPCKLVSTSEARSITGGAVTTSIEAPLGPTCVYERSSPKSEITLAVESMSFSQVTSQMPKRSQVLVGGHRAVCGRPGTEMLFVPLAHGQVLNVTAPCSVAQRFAALALSRLAA